MGKKAAYKALLSFEFNSSTSLKAAYDSLIAETEFSKKGKSKIFTKGENILVVKIWADSLASFKASLLSYLRLMQIIKTLDQEL
ncbi:MAG: KEOPS complex subunit Pcc1 [Candidatus Anstonellaceae archaeon]